MENLWNEDVDEHVYGGDKKAYQDALLEQYKIYVEMADRVSQRRGLTNTFFLTLNTGIFALVGIFWRNPLEVSPGWLIFPLVAVLGECFAWFYLVKSYRQLNTAKFQVIGALEERLPSSPYWSAEWFALGEGKKRSLYWPLSHIEQWIPPLFAISYIAGFVAVILI